MERWEYAIVKAQKDDGWHVSYTHQTGDPPVSGALLLVLYNLGNSGWEMVGRLPNPGGSVGLREPLIFKRRQQ